MQFHYGRVVILAAWMTAASAQSLLTSTYLGGSASDTVRAMATDSAGNLYVLGETYSPDFPVTANALQPKHGGVPGSDLMIGDTHATDLFITKLSLDGRRILWSTYLGGSGMDTAGGIAVDATGNVYVAGSTGSPNFPVTPGAFQTTVTADLYPRHGYIAKIAADGSKLLWSTLVAGSGVDAITAIALDASGVYVTGTTSSNDFPTTPGAWQTKGRSEPVAQRLRHQALARRLQAHLFHSARRQPGRFARGHCGRR